MLRFNEPIQSGLNEVSVRTGSTDATDGDLEVDGSTGAPIIEVRYAVERPQESTYQARWSWRQLP